MKIFVNIYISLFALYYLQGTLYSFGSIVGRLLLLVIIFISFYYWVYAMTRFKLPKPLIFLSYLLVIWSIYGVQPILVGISIPNNKVDSFYVLKGQYLSLLPIFAFYVFARKGWLTEKMLQVWTIPFFIVGIASFYFNNDLVLQRVAERGGNRDEITNNAGYLMVSLIPLLSLYSKRPTLQYILLGICMWFVLIGFKRGAIVAGVICSLWLIYHSFKMNRKSAGIVLHKQVTRVVLTILIVMGAYYAVQYLLSASDFFVERVERTFSGDSSGREIIYSTLYEHFMNETSVLRYLFGNGAYGTLFIASNFAHNDWLEIVIDNGLVMVLMYAAYWVSLFVMLINSKRNTTTTLMLGLFIILYFIKTFVSMSYNDIPFYSSCALGYALANYEPQHRKKGSVI